MSTILGFKQNDVIYMVSDTQATRGARPEKLDSGDSKIIKIGDMLIGLVGSLQSIQRLRYDEELPEWISSLNKLGKAQVKKMLFGDLPFILKEILDDCDCEGQVILVGYKGLLVVYDPVYSPALITEDMVSVGSGSSYAEGFMYGKRKELTDPTKVPSILKEAIQCAAKFDIYTSGLTKVYETR